MTLPPWLLAVVLLTASNVFMTFAWYYHLKHKGWSLTLAIAVSWGIALFEYILQVPANRIGSQTLTTPQLKIIQEAITMTVFIVFTITVLGDKPRLTDYLGIALIFAGVAVAMSGKIFAAAPVTP
ncbi:MAG: DMT family protein [Phycisphaerales bacterium]